MLTYMKPLIEDTRSTPVLLRLVSLVILAHTLLAPFHKVEENFGTNGIYEILSNLRLEEYAHFRGQDWVQRSPLPLFILAGLSRLSRLVFRIVPIYLHPRLWTGFLTFWSVSYLSEVIRKRFGVPVTNMFLLFLVVQFHIPFYASRLLVNTFGLSVCLLGIGLHLDGRPLLGIGVLVFASFSVRLDLFCVGIGLGVDYLLCSGKSTAKEVTRRFFLGCLAGISGLAIAGAICVPIDSYYYNRFPFWAELSVIFFNVVENKSHIWGSQPWHWYFSDALPRGVGLPILALLVNLKYSRESVRLLVCLVLIPVLILSLLPHKETRFIFPSIAVLTIVAAKQAAALLNKKRVHSFTSPVTILILGASFAIACMRLLASACNYPGGETWASLAPFLKGDRSLPALILPWIIRYIPQSLVQLSPGPVTTGHSLLSIPKICKVYNGYLSEISGYSKFLSDGVPCTITRAEDSRRDGSRNPSDADIKNNDWVIADYGSHADMCGTVVSVTYGFERIDIRGARIVLKPEIVVCRGHSE